ncbi:MAG TPA: DUF3578 domain-containing protein [Rhizomicrobium sp.]|jgi:5-methylcytosine-specific restriction protein A|nr:DUF3578 domain-containing protein [Rhizomicrobium sp.]
MLREALARIGNQYQSAREELFADNPLANFIRDDAADAVRKLIDLNEQRFICKGSAGAGRFAAVPWIAIFDSLVTRTATQGYYVVYLFSSTGDFYLSLNQGATAVRREFGKKAQTILQDRASLVRARLPEFSETLSCKEITLSSHGDLPEHYEYGHSIGCKYQIDALPGENQMVSDLLAALSAYQILTFRGGLDPSMEATSEFNDERERAGSLVEIRTYKLHRTIERNPRVADQVKFYLGTSCQVCSLNFSEKYGELGEGYIEAHHLRPLSTLEEGVAVHLDPARDFAVLCSNCHRMAHRLDDPSDIVYLRTLIRL